MPLRYILIILSAWQSHPIQLRIFKLRWNFCFISKLLISSLFEHLSLNFAKAGLIGCLLTVIIAFAIPFMPHSGHKYFMQRQQFTCKRRASCAFTVH